MTTEYSEVLADISARVAQAEAAHNPRLMAVWLLAYNEVKRKQGEHAAWRNQREMAA